MAVDLAQLRWPATISVYCSADVELRRHGLFVIGSVPFVAAALGGYAVLGAIGKGRARQRAAPQWRVVSQGEVRLDPDRVIVRWPDGNDVHVPYRTITSWRRDRDALELERVGWAPLRIEVHDLGSFQQWFEYFAAGKTWVPPRLQTVEAMVPVVGSCQQDRRFAFGVPAGWSDADREWLAWVGEDYTPARVVAGVRRLSPPVALNFVVLEIPRGEEPTLDSVASRPDEVAAQMAYFSGGSFSDPVELLDLDGEAATSFHISQPGAEPQERTYLFVTHAGSFFGAVFAVLPTPADDGPYRQALPELHTMLATWHWVD